MRADINIDMDKECGGCGKKGACQNGLCLDCTVKRLEMGDTEEMLRRIEIVRQQLGAMAVSLITYNVMMLLADLAREQKENEDKMAELTLKFCFPVMLKRSGRGLYASGSLEWTRKMTRKASAEGIDIDFDQQELPFTETASATPATDDLIEAERIIREVGRASVSMLQRRMRVGYTRASAIMDALEAAGVVGPPNGSNPREILAETEEKGDE